MILQDNILFLTGQIFTHARSASRDLQTYCANKFASYEKRGVDQQCSTELVLFIF